MLLGSLSHCAACLLWVLCLYRRPGRGAGPWRTVYAEVLCLPSVSKGQVTESSDSSGLLLSLSAKAAFG